MEESYFGFVYETKNLVNGKKYIGKCIFGRKNNWKSYLGSGLYLKRAIEKYGKENFSRRILFLAKTEEELNSLEEKVIESVGAVVSEEYYNLKETSIGGDTFTTNPRKEEIRAKHSLNSSGEKNYWYGREKPEGVIKSIREANSKKVLINGKRYDSLTDFHKESGVPISTISYRLNNPKNEDYLYL